MKRLMAVVLLAMVCGCSPSTNFGGTCETPCDCEQTYAPVRCIGEWICNAEKTCEYECKAPCVAPPYTCASDETCNGSFCSERGSCP